MSWEPEVPDSLHRDRRLLVAAVAGVLLLAVVVGVFLASQGGEIKLVEAKATATPAVIGVYVSIENATGDTVCIVDARIAENAEVMVELHETKEEQGLYMMTPVEEICIPPGETLAMRHGPGSYHIMIMGDRAELDKILADGVVEITIVFNNGKEIYVEAPLED